jgi:RNA polymerase sigma-70 factor (ECF subfamily)
LLAEHNYETKTDTETLQMAIRGDESAFTYLYNENQKQILKFVSRRVDDASSAEDLTATIFMKVWEKLGVYQDRGLPFKAWLFRIARNSVIDYYRARRNVAPLEVVENTPDGARPILDFLADREELNQVINLLNLLTITQREVLVLRLIQGLGTREIAQKVGKKAGAVRAIQMRGLESLVAIVREQGLLEP